MVSDASYRPTDPKMNKSFVHSTAQTSSNHEYAQDEYLKRPHPTIIVRDMRSDSGWFLGGLEVVRHLAHD